MIWGAWGEGVAGRAVVEEAREAGYGAMSGRFVAVACTFSLVPCRVAFLRMLREERPP